MSSPCNYMEHPDWTPEQRVAMTRVAVLRLTRGTDHLLSTLTVAPVLPPVEHPLARAAVSTFAETPA